MKKRKDVTPPSHGEIGEEQGFLVLTPEYTQRLAKAARLRRAMIEVEIEERREEEERRKRGVVPPGSARTRSV